MHKAYHEELTRKALADSFSPAALDTVVAANLGQDSLLNLLRSEYHFDANAFDKAFEYARLQEEEVIACLARGASAGARQAFGRLAHALQDYYAHTNYIALWLELHPDIDPEAGEEVAVDPLIPKILDCSRLHAARVYYPLEALTIFPALVASLQRRLPADSHANMNLDHPGRGATFALAMTAARRRTELAFVALSDRIRDELGPGALAEFTLIQ